MNIVLIVTATYIIYLGVQNDLRLYIHPRYITFTIVLSTVGLAVTLYHYATADTAGHKHKESDHSQHSQLTLIPLLFVLGLAVLQPARSLSSATASQRQTDAGSIVATTEQRSVSSIFSGSSRGLRLFDWAVLLSTQTEPSYYANKPAKVSGFTFDGGDGQNVFALSRFVVTCCAVDAQPIGVPVLLDSWQDTYDEDTWLEIEGSFRLTPTDSGDKLVLIPDKITEIEEPSNPYAN